MKLLFIINHYHSSVSPNIINTNELIKFCLDKGDTIDILSTDNVAFSGYPLIKKENRIRVFCFLNEYNKAVQKYNNSSISSFKNLPKHRKLVCKSFCFIKSLFKMKTGYYAVEAMSFRNIRATIDKKYDVIMSESSPFVSHLIASYLIKKRCSDRWFPILFDPYAYNEIDKKSGINYRKYVEAKILKRATKVFQLMGIENINHSKGYYPSYDNRCVSIPLFNLFERNVKYQSPKKQSDIRMQYIGNFYYNLRNPGKMMDILSLLPEQFEIHFAGGGCEKVIYEKSKLFNRSVFFNDGVLDYKIIESVYEKSDILLFLDNERGGQFPSKCFEYISYCKPIINFYYDDSSLSYRFLRNYECSLHINLNKFKDSDVDKIISFCQLSKNVIINYNAIIKQYSSFEKRHVLNGIYRLICGANEQS